MRDNVVAAAAGGNSGTWHPDMHTGVWLWTQPNVVAIEKLNFQAYGSKTTKAYSYYLILLEVVTMPKLNFFQAHVSPDDFSKLK